MNFNVRLKNLLNEEGISQSQLARGVNKSKSSVSAWVSGKTIPPMETQKEIAEFLNRDVAYFIEDVVVELDLNNKSISVVEAARLIGKTPHFVRLALRQGTAPFGFAVKDKQWSYHISRKLLMDYIGGDVING